LIGRKKKNGGFELNNSKSYQMCYKNIQKELTEAYIYWALTEANIVGLDSDLEYITSNLIKTNDPYVFALVAIILNNLRQEKKSNDLLEYLCKFQSEDGSVKGNSTITGSGGKSLLIETTSLCLLGWMNNKKYETQTFKAIQWIYKNCEGGSFGSSQASALALKAISKFKSKDSEKEGKLSFELNGKFFKEVEISPFNTEVIQMELDLKPGLHDIIVSSNISVPISTTVNYSTLLPNSDKECLVGISTKLSDSILEEGSITEIQVEILNLSNKSQTMTVGMKLI
jgi:alpha-2-macroglobulin-like protein